MDLYTTFTVFIIPSIAFLAPFIILTGHILRNNLVLTIEQRTLLIFTATTILLTGLIFLLLSYLTGDLNSIYFGTPGFFSFNGGFGYIIGNTISFTFRFDPGIALIVVSFLSALLYSSLLVLPTICTLIPEGSQVDGSKASTSVTGSMTAVVSAVASTAICCSTSVVAVLAPTVLTILGPFAPFLIYVSLAILVYSFITIVLPRFPTGLK